MDKALKINEDLRKNVEESLEAIRKVGADEFKDISEKLEWVLGSYDFDKNPVGLQEIGDKALAEMKSYKEKNPRKIAKKTIDNLEKSLNKYTNNK